MKRYFALQMGVFALELSAKIFEKEKDPLENNYIVLRLRVKAEQLKKLM